MIVPRLAASMVVLVACGATLAAAWAVYSAPGQLFEGEPRAIQPLDTGGEPVLLTIEPGASARDIGAQLAEADVVRSGRLFEVLVGLTGVQDSLEAGDYEFDPGTPAIEVVRRIAAGRTAARRVTIQEGLRIEEIGELLEKNRIVSKQAFIDAAAAGGYSEPFLEQVGGRGLEGFLFPAGYEFNRDTDAGQIVATMLRAFQDQVADGLSLEGQPLSLFELVTLGSIVQREAGTVEEMPTIASVYLNRVRLGMPLQADPTVQYALSQDSASVEQYGWWKEGLTFEDLEFDSPYNTYVYPGLPPGPIANPGLDAMTAVIRPTATEYLYFVAKGDGTGTHAFAETLEEHLQNVARYQLGQ